MTTNPHAVVAPKSRLKHHRPIHHVPDWALAVGIWDDHRALLIRWNGDADRPKGNPVSHAQPTWFVLPEDLHVATLSAVSEPNRTSATEWLAGGNPTRWVDPISN